MRSSVEAEIPKLGLKFDGEWGTSNFALSPFKGLCRGYPTPRVARGSCAIKFECASKTLDKGHHWEFDGGERPRRVLAYR